MNYSASSKKLCILVDSLGSGGAERSAGLLSKALSVEGFLVHTVIFIDVVQYEYEGELLNLGKKFGDSFFQKLKKYAALQNYLREQDFGFVLDFRMKDFPVRELLLNFSVLKKQRCINMVRSGNLDFYFPKPKSLSRRLYENYFGINAVSERLKEKIEQNFGFNNVFSLPSPLDFEAISKFSNSKKMHEKEFMIAAGRMDEDDTKQFGKLIETYANSTVTNYLDLLILGEGSNKTKLKKLIACLGLEEKVHLIPFQDPFPFFAQAKFFVLSSKYEGFPRVVIESLACGTPVVAFDCDYGPSEVIETGFNGILVENQNFDALEIAMEKMQNDEAFFQKQQSNSQKSVERFGLKKVGEQWREYLLQNAKKR